MWQNMWDRSLDKKVRMYQLVWIRRMPMTRKQCWKPEHQHVYNVSSESWSYDSYIYPRIFVTYLQQTLLCVLPLQTLLPTCGRHSFLFCCQFHIQYNCQLFYETPFIVFFSNTNSLHLNLFQVGSLPKPSASWPEEVSAVLLKKKKKKEEKESFFF